MTQKPQTKNQKWLCLGV